MADGVVDDRRGRCEFPGCTCTCMERNTRRGICVRCFHVDAWHVRLPSTGAPSAEAADPFVARPCVPPQRRAPSPPRVSQRPTDVSEIIIANILSEEMKTDRTLCCVCLTRHCNVVLKPCGHARFCKECILSMGRTAPCPLCRTQISRLVNFVPI